MRRYVLCQFLVAVAGVLLIAKSYAEQGAFAVLVPCLLLWATLYTLGLMNEARSYAVRFELVRLILLVPLSIAAMIDSSLIAGRTQEVWLIMGIYMLTSATGLKFASTENDVQEKIIVNN